MTAQTVTDVDFDTEVLQSDLPVLVDFWASWCMPCKALAPVLEDLAADLKDRIKVVKVNIEDAPEAPAKYGVRGIPTLILFKGGKPVDTKVGGAPKSRLVEWIEGLI
ncbi:MAG TPA: thioredoxin [Rhodospirillaceae bacterium]|nr:thioredoxin [Alphaproteobacteria bacterium]HBH25785.1 thioredoxin [Rhodospirillaceae bacterium]